MLWRPRRLRYAGFTLATIICLLALLAVRPEWHGLERIGITIPPSTALLVLLLALVCEYMDSSLGMGYGTTLTPVLLAAGFEPLQIVPTILLSECLSGFVAGVFHQRDRNIDLLRDAQARKTTIWLSLLSALGAIAAVAVAVSISRFWLTAAIGIIIVAMGLVILATIGRQLRYRPGHLIAIGAVAAFNKGLSGGGYGPLVTAGQVVSGISPKCAVAVTSLAEALTCLVGLVAYFTLQGVPDWSLAAPLVAGALLSVPAATLTVRFLPERAVRSAVGLGTVALGALTLARLLLR
jgi:uncharacterized membrane protein YfcA